VHLQGQLYVAGDGSIFAFGLTDDISPDGVDQASGIGRTPAIRLRRFNGCNRPFADIARDGADVAKRSSSLPSARSTTPACPRTRRIEHREMCGLQYAANA